MSLPAEGLRYNEGKPRYDLLDPDALEGIARVLEFGARKYAAHNWRNGLKFSDTIRSLLSHAFAILRGETHDKESGLPHIDHLGCNWMFLSWHFKHRPDMNDLWKPKKDEDY